MKFIYIVNFPTFRIKLYKVFYVVYYTICKIHTVNLRDVLRHNKFTHMYKIFILKNIYSIGQFLIPIMITEQKFEALW